MDKIYELEDKMIKSLESTFEYCYSCTRVWSAWAYDTMTANDFVPFNKDDDSFNEALNSLKESIIKNPLKDVDDFAERVENVICNYQLYFNENIDRNFSSDSFNDDILGIISVTDMYNDFNNYAKAVNAESNLINSIERTFENCYTCKYHWSGWDNGSMITEDFVQFTRDHDLFPDFLLAIKSDLTAKESLKDSSNFDWEIMNLIYDFKLMHNESLRDYFAPEYFKEEVWNIIDTRGIFEPFKEYKKAVIQETPSNNKKIKPL